MTATAPPCQLVQVFNLHIKGTGTVTLFGEPAGDNGLFDIFVASYTLTGTATVVPEPSTLLMFAAGIPGCGACVTGACGTIPADIISADRHTSFEAAADFSARRRLSVCGKARGTASWPFQARVILRGTLVGADGG